MDAGHGASAVVRQPRGETAFWVKSPAQAEPAVTGDRQVTLSPGPASSGSGSKGVGRASQKWTLIHFLLSWHYFKPENLSLC